MSSLLFQLACITSLTLASPVFVHSQTTVKPHTSSKAATRKEKSETATEAEETAKARRVQGASLLISLANDARSFRDLTVRARSLGRIADALWDTNPDQARVLFTKAWEAAESAEKESKQPVRLREEVLRLAATHDRKLAEAFLQQLKSEQSDNNSAPPEPNLWKLSDAMEKRLNLASNLLASGDVRHSLEFAEPLLGNVTISTLEFLTTLREREATVADRFYAGMLANTRQNASADANTISLLSSYLFTPHMYVTFTDNGRANTSWRPSVFPPANVDQELRLRFFETAASVLLQPVPTVQEQQTAIVIRYMVDKRLLPLFEQYAPASLGASLRAQVELLTPLLSKDLRNDDDEWLRKGIDNESAASREQSLLEQIDHAGSSAERDDLYLKLALLALDKNNGKARDYAGKIDRGNLRKGAFAWVDWISALRAIEQDKHESALELVRTGELTHIQRVWILTAVAKARAKLDREQARTLINNATAEVNRIDSSDLNRPRGLLAIANALREVEPAQAWEVAFDAVKAANSVDDFTGEDGSLTSTLNNSSQILRRTDATPDFEIPGLFEKLARTDADRTIELARGFQSEGPRALATIAIASVLLKDQKPPNGAAQTSGRN